MSSRKRKASGGDDSPVVVGEDLREWMRKNDVELFVSQKKVARARKSAESSLGRKVSLKEFRAARAEECEWWGARRRKPCTSSTHLSPKSWDKLKKAVEKVLPEIHGRPFAHAVEIIRTVAACNQNTLNGLPARLRVWQ